MRYSRNSSWRGYYIADGIGCFGVIPWMQYCLKYHSPPEVSSPTDSDLAVILTVF